MIYGIYSTQDNYIRYIGITKKGLAERLVEHKANPTNPAMRCFFDFAGKTVEIRELFEFDSEKEAVDFHRNLTPCRLLNSRSGAKSVARSQMTYKAKKKNTHLGTLVGCDEKQKDQFTETSRLITDAKNYLRRRTKNLEFTEVSEKGLCNKDYSELSFSNNFYVATFTYSTRKIKKLQQDIIKVKNISILAFDVKNIEDNIELLKGYEYDLLEYEDTMKIVFKLATPLNKDIFEPVTEFMKEHFGFIKAHDPVDVVSSDYIDHFHIDGKYFDIVDFYSNDLFKIKMYHHYSRVTRGEKQLD